MSEDVTAPVVAKDEGSETSLLSMIEEIEKEKSRARAERAQARDHDDAEGPRGRRKPRRRGQRNGENGYEELGDVAIFKPSPEMVAILAERESLLPGLFDSWLDIIETGEDDQLVILQNRLRQVANLGNEYQLAEASARVTFEAESRAEALANLASATEGQAAHLFERIGRTKRVWVKQPQRSNRRRSRRREWEVQQKRIMIARMLASDEPLDQAIEAFVEDAITIDELQAIKTSLANPRGVNPSWIYKEVAEKPRPEQQPKKKKKKKGGADQAQQTSAKKGGGQRGRRK